MHFGYFRKLSLALALCLYLVSLVSCKKKDSGIASGNLLGSYSFTASDLAILPYPLSDTAIFKSNEGDSILFIFRGRNSSISDYYKYPTNPAGTKGDYYTYEENFTSLTSQNSDNLFFHLFFSNPFKEQSGIKYFSIGIVVENSGICSFMAQFRFDAGAITSYLPDSAFISGGYVKAFYKTHKIGPRNFQDVYELKAPVITNNCPVFVSTAWYTIKEGIVGFDKSSGKTWYLRE